MKLIVGLGNPGKEYAKTRHNVGFWCVEAWLKTLSGVREKGKWDAQIVETNVRTEPVILMRPQTFMNRSGLSVARAVREKGLDPERDLLVIYDDMDLPAGALRLREKGSSGGHNGIKSIIQELGTQNFARIRVGIGRPEPGILVIDHVLHAFSRDDRIRVEAAVDRAVEAAQAFCVESFPLVMNRFNSASNVK
ncbi:aminoacyl-tRNA hydrolase [Ferroacidibacillus organovorans]|uniref:Peptidyl-tRNA hydrolase n=1 Tax=Ferroacidibacillus organovorans TaxID=1765683 RepID=A0A124IW86_9BACL|nr:aminoacyl-tRNA hydrolase [Ferroacidibacillus organovorans]KUO96604.1 peptidyl-tRNA hydrolase [Ferroacidibacillus organovorans]